MNIEKILYSPMEDFFLTIVLDQLFDGRIPGKFLGGKHIIRILDPLIAFEDRLDDLSLG